MLVFVQVFISLISLVLISYLMLKRGVSSWLTANLNSWFIQQLHRSTRTRWFCLYQKYFGLIIWVYVGKNGDTLSIFIYYTVWWWVLQDKLSYGGARGESVFFMWEPGESEAQVDKICPGGQIQPADHLIAAHNILTGWTKSKKCPLQY